MHDDLPPLPTSIQLLRAAMKDFPSSAHGFLPDRVFFDLAIDVAEHTTAVELLAKSAVPRAAFANARAALESATDLLYMVGDPATFESKACRARVAAMLEGERLHKRFAKANAAAQLPGIAIPDIEAAVLQEATDWDSVAPGKGRALRIQLEWGLANLKGQEHWSGLDRTALMTEVARMINSDPGWVEFHQALYGGLSIHTHARPRAAKRATTAAETGLVITGDPGDGELAETLASLACLFATEALARKRASSGIAT